jgi:TRAP-type C4-dicarboxylate transport system permease small subunit
MACRITGWCAAAALAAIMLLMLCDVTGRYVFNAPVPGAGELIELAMGVVVFGALPLVTARNKHIQLDYFSRAVRGRVQSAVNAFIALINAGIMAVLAWRILDKALTVYQYGDSTPFLRIPVAPVAFFIAACTLLAAIAFLFLSAQSLRSIFCSPAKAHHDAQGA